MFKIVITETCEAKKTIGNEWKIIGRDGDDKDAYGYTPEVVATRNVEVERLSQTIDTLDILAVIKAINGIETPRV